MTSFTFTAALWQWTAASSAGTWYFVTVTEDISDQIEDMATGPRAGFGSVRVRVTVGESTWDTSVFPSKEHAAFILPIKKAVRLAESWHEGDSTTVTLEVLA